MSQVEVDALWSQMGEGSPPLTQGGGGEGGEEPERPEPPVSEQTPPEASPEGDWGAAEGQGQSGAGGGGAGSEGQDSVLARLDALQRQLEEQGRLLRRVCRQLGPAAGDSEE